MSKLALMALLFWGTAAGAQTKPSDIIGSIDFYGYQGMNVSAVRTALPVHSGSLFTGQTKQAVGQAIAASTGKPPTDVSRVCCDPEGQSIIYIGLQGGTFKPFVLNPAPTGGEHLSPDVVGLYNRADRALDEAVMKGDAEEDDSQGYALAKDSALRALQMRERAWAVANGPLLLRALRDSASSEQREMASDLLGYGQQSPDQIAALIHASRDPDPVVRNNATRALAVLVTSNPKLAAEIDPETFIAMLSSGIWLDRNKATFLLSAMTAQRDPQLLAKLRAQALPQLIEMARWSDPGHAVGARLILGRIAGIPEDKLSAMAWNGPTDAIIQAVTKP